MQALNKRLYPFLRGTTILPRTKKTPCVSVQGSLSIMASTQYFTVNPHYNDSYTVFAVAHEETSRQAHGIDWVYYYFPKASYYLNYIDRSFYDYSRCEPIELADWQIDKVAHHVVRFMEESITPNAIDEVEQYMRALSQWKLYWNLPLPLMESSRNQIWCQAWHKISSENSVVEGVNARLQLSKWYEEKLLQRSSLINDWEKTSAKELPVSSVN